MKFSGPAIVHNGILGVDRLNIQGSANPTGVPSGTESKEPEPSSTRAIDHDWMPVAAARSVVTLPSESWRMIPPPDPEEKLIEPVIDAACADEARASRRAHTIRGGDMRFIIFTVGNLMGLCDPDESRCQLEPR